MKLLSIFLLTLYGFLPCLAQITVNGLTNQSTHTGDVTFTIPSEAGFTIDAILNDRIVPTDTPVTESEPGYHELKVTKTPDDEGTTEELTLQFIVRDPSRPSSDNGISTWTPRPAVSAPAAVLDNTRVTFVTPRFVEPGMTFPIAVRLETPDGKIARFNASPLLVDALGNASVIKVLRGAGSGTWTAPETGPVELSLHLGNRIIQKEVILASPAGETLNGELTGSLTLTEGSITNITGDLLVPTGTTLRFERGSLVRLAPGATIEVFGTLEVAGTIDSPVVFHPSNPAEPWGGFFLQGGTSSADVDGAFLTGGGAESNWTSDNGFSSHRKEQPIFAFDAGSGGGTCIATLTDTWIVDNPTAQAGHGRNAEITFERCLIQRATTAGQYNGGSVRFFDSHAMEFPIDSPDFSDADNDGFYLTGGDHHIRGSVIGWTKDDGIDCGGSADGTLLVEDSWIDSCFHEGFALSGDKLVTITNTVSINNGQGLEVGYSADLDRPDATATNMLIVGNAHGARYGDNYDWNYKGKLSVSSSFILQNRKDVFGVEFDSWSYREEDMTIENNVVTAPLARHPENENLDPGSHANSIGNFLNEGEAPRGFSIVERRSQNPRNEYGGELSLHLDRPAASPVIIPWQIMTPETVIASGTLEFPPGEVFQTLLLPPLEAPHQSAHWIGVSFQNSPSAMATGASGCHFLDLPGDPTPTETTLVAFGSEWSYLSDGSNQGTAWRDPEFDDSSWESGAGQLGYGDGDEETDVGYAGTSSTKNATTYFRHQFEVTDPSSFSSLSLDLLFDDGAVVYLNGNRIAAANMPEGEPAFDFYIGTTSSDDDRESFSIESSLLVSGTNTLAVEVHQEGGSSSDISFDLEVIALPKPEEEINFLMAPFHNERFLFWTTGGVIPQTSSDLGTWQNRPDLIAPITVSPQPSFPATQFFRLMKSQ